MSSLDDFGNTWSDGPVKKAPTILRLVALVSILVGVAIGGFGLTRTQESLQFACGAGGYLLCVVAPIVILQVVRSRHNAAIKAVRESEQAYDSYSGEQLQSNMLKVVLVGMVLAALPLWVLTLPFASRLAA